jgi:putative peptide zinc metalloprotease protein
VKKPRLYATLGIVAAVVAAVLFVKLPHSVMTTLEVQPRDAVPVWIDVGGGGKLVHVYVEPGQHVSSGQKLADLQNLDLELDIEKLEGDHRRYQAQLRNLQREGLHDRESAGQIPEVQKALETVENQLREKRQDQQRLHLVAPCDGTVLPPPAVTAHDDPDGQLPSWSGTPLEPQNLGAYLREGPHNESVMFCQIGDPKSLQANLVIDQSEMECVREGQAVDIKLDELPHDTLRSRIVEIARTELKVTPRLLSTKSGGTLASTTDPQTGIERPQSTSYEAHVPLDDPDGLMRLGLRGQGKIHADWMPLGTRLWRLVMHTFNFKM